MIWINDGRMKRRMNSHRTWGSKIDNVLEKTERRVPGSGIAWSQDPWSAPWTVFVEVLEGARHARKLESTDEKM